jgi:hypothetical protein
MDGVFPFAPDVEAHAAGTVRQESCHGRCREDGLLKVIQHEEDRFLADVIP